MIARLFKLIAISAFYVGRIETPLFAKGVGEIGPVPIDSYPVQFRKDLVVHDAHRHPYMKRLGVNYMLKLRYGDSFAKPAGSARTLIVVEALMPWLLRFRLNEGAETDEETPKNIDTSTANVPVAPLTEEEGPKVTRDPEADMSAPLAELKIMRSKTLELEIQNTKLSKELDDMLKQKQISL